MTRHADVRAALTDPAFQVPAVDIGPPGSLAWLRGTVSRFSPHARHAERRAIGVRALAALDPDELRHETAHLTATALDGAADGLDVMRELARPVPLRVLAGRLGFADPVAAGTVVRVVAGVPPGVDPGLVRRADRAVAALLALAPPGPPEVRANLIGLLVQACDATAGLIGAAAHRLLPPGGEPPGRAATVDLLAEVLRLDPPVRATRRVTTTGVRLGGRDLPPGSPVLLRFDAANRDPLVFAEPDEFRPGRGGGLLTFGAGSGVVLATGTPSPLPPGCSTCCASAVGVPDPTCAMTRTRRCAFRRTWR
ncbi:hypothetical protein GCM10027614_11460 [Micromonospora vulcania]